MRREMWHGLGDVQLLHTFLHSCVALAGVLISLSVLLAVTVGFWGAFETASLFLAFGLVFLLASALACFRGYVGIVCRGLKFLCPAVLSVCDRRGIGRASTPLAMRLRGAYLLVVPPLADHAAEEIVLWRLPDDSDPPESVTSTDAVDRCCGDARCGSGDS